MNVFLSIFFLKKSDDLNDSEVFRLNSITGAVKSRAEITVEGDISSSVLYLISLHWIRVKNSSTKNVIYSPSCSKPNFDI